MVVLHPHFINTPGYVYAYAYGQLLALSVYRRYEEQGDAFVPRYLELLRAGGSMAPAGLAGSSIAISTIQGSGMVGSTSSTPRSPQPRTQPGPPAASETAARGCGRSVIGGLEPPAPGLADDEPRAPPARPAPGAGARRRALDPTSARRRATARPTRRPRPPGRCRCTATPAASGAACDRRPYLTVGVIVQLHGQNGRERPPGPAPGCCPGQATWAAELGSRSRRGDQRPPRAPTATASPGPRPPPARGRARHQGRASTPPGPALGRRRPRIWPPHPRTRAGDPRADDVVGGARGGLTPRSGALREPSNHP